MLRIAAIHMRKSHSSIASLLVSLLLPVVGLMSIQGCEAPRGNTFSLDSTKILEPRGELRDVLTWPLVTVGPVGGNLDTASRSIIQERLQDGLVQKQFSPLSLDFVQGLVEQYGATEANAIRALAAAKADAVLILSIGEWDESGLYTLGRIQAKGEIKLVDRKGQVRWGGNLKVDSTLVPSKARSASLEEKRRVAVERFALELARRLPSQF